ncbi:MAG TPA: alginate lyase family protein [bacterium]|jgi:hypothetical protein|nr:alginate lyase family protein [bacterium]
MRYLFAVLVWITEVSALSAGVVSFTDAEILKIRSLVTDSPDAARWSTSLVNNAKNSMSAVPHPIENIQSAGKLKGSVEKNQTEEALKDFYRLKNIEWAYIFTGDQTYEQKAAEYVLAWAKVCRPPENPIDGTNLETLIETYDLIRPQMEPANQQVVDQWLKSVIDTLFNSDIPTKGVHTNNWQAHRLKIIAMAAFTLGDQAVEQQALEALKTLMTANLNADGTTLDFLERDALHYHVYDLEPMIRTAMIYQRAQGLDLYHWNTDKGASIAQCVAFLFPFAKGEKTHAEYVHTTVKFDLQRAQNHEKGHGIGEAFDPKASQKCLELAQFFEPQLTSLVGSLTTTPNSAYPSLQILINEAIRPSAGQLKP